MKHFNVSTTALSGLKLVERLPIVDDRGSFQRLWCADELKEIGWSENICQINHSLTQKKGTVRGLHFQKAPHAETKFISCLRGRVFDVVVDLRKGSPTFLKWHGEILAAGENKSLLVPKGFAHGFQTLENGSEMIYLHSDFYNAAVEDGLLADDAVLKINWPLAITDRSPRDQKHAPISKDWKGLEV